jgi:hypothetical protein
MVDHRKVLRFEKTHCPQCDFIGIEIVRYNKEISPVFFIDEDFLECADEECGYREKIKLSEKRFLKNAWEYNPKF